MQIGAGMIIAGSRIAVFHPVELLDALLASDVGNTNTETDENVEAVD